jgi:integrase
VHDGIVPRNPCSRRTSPGTGKQRPYVATTEQVWALHNAVPAGIRPAILLGAHAGLRLAEAAALRPEDVDFIRGVVSPTIQWPNEPLKSDTSKTRIPIPNELSLELSAAVAQGRGLTIVTAEDGRPIAGPWAIERTVRDARTKVEGLPAQFRFHDLRHYFASLLIASGLDVKVVQARLRHASAKTTLDTYGHLWPDKDESWRAAVAASTHSEHVRKAEGARADRLEYVVRAGESSDDLARLLRRGEDTSAKLLRQAITSANGHC